MGNVLLAFTEWEDWSIQQIFEYVSSSLLGFGLYM